MEETIDILAFLEQVMLENTHSYRSDFQFDIRKLTAAAQAPEAENRAFYWMSRPCGTWCLRCWEIRRDIFCVSEMPANNMR